MRNSTQRFVFIFHGISFIFKLTRSVRQVMSTQKVSQQLFMKVKERLDYHRLPSTFPVEAAPLLNKLLRIIDSRSTSEGFVEPQQFCGDSVSAALKHETARLVKQNNELHMNLIVAKEQIQSLQHQLFKTQANKHSNEKGLQRLSSIKSKREQELVTEVQQIKYKYNELMDFLHEDPYAEKEYIKRLMKHKQIEGSSIQTQEPKQVVISKPIDSHYRVRELETMVKHRQTQILRLQKVIEYDGVNLNKIIKNFNEDLVKKQLKSADHKINYLQESFDQIKKENTSMRNKNGLKQALRGQVEKCHKIISTLKKENNQLKRNHIQQNFDLEKKTSENDRKIGKAKLQKSHSERQIEKLQGQVCDLGKKIQYLKKELNEVRKSNQSSAELIEQKETETINFRKKNEEIKVFYQYEIEALSKRKNELEAELEETRLKARELLSQYQLKSNENELKTESIFNLEKIVNELIRKNSVLADHTSGTLEESLKQSAELQMKNRFNEQERQLVFAQKERTEIETNMRVLQNRFEQVISQNERFRYENGKLRGELTVQTESVLKFNNEIDRLSHLLKREEAQKNRILNLSEEAKRTKNTQMSELEDENERLKQQEKALKLRLKDLQIKISEEEGVWEVTRIRLEDKQTKIKQLQKLLGQTVDQIKELSNQINELEHQNHELTKEKHRLGKKYDELRKDEDEFKSSSFKNYQTAINDNLAEISALKKQLMRLSQSYQGLQVRYEEVSNMVNVLQREKQLIQFDKISLIQEAEILNTRVMEMQEIERTLVLQNESLRSLGRSL